MKEDNTDTCSQDSACKQIDYAGNVILSLSDLHFMKHKDKATIAKNRNTQNDLIRCVKGLPSQWKPNIICITGDISYKNRRGGYEQAEAFITMLLKELDLTPKNLVICPGNHDIDAKKASKYFRDKTVREVIEDFEIPISSKYDEFFSSYIAFCKKLGIPECRYGEHASYLFGIRSINDINFIVCNSSWFYVNQGEESRWTKLFGWLFKEKKKKVQDADKGMWLCLPLLEYLESEHDILSRKQNHQQFFIGMLHHPSRELSIDETNRYDESRNPPAADYLAKRADLVLTGHMHGLPLGETSFISTPSISCGSTLQEVSPNKSFYIIKVEKYKGDYISFRFNATSSVNKWIKDENEGTILFEELNQKICKYANEQSIQSLISLLDGAACPMLAPESIGSLYESDIKSLLEELEALLEEAEYHIKKLEFCDAFDIADDIVTKLAPVNSLTQSKALSDIYVRLAYIEISRVEWNYLKSGLPKNYSQVKEFFQKAKNAYKE